MRLEPYPTAQPHAVPILLSEEVSAVTPMRAMHDADGEQRCASERALDFSAQQRRHDHALHAVQQIPERFAQQYNHDDHQPARASQIRAQAFP